MSHKPNILIRFWNELQRRKVFKVLAMYAGTAFIIIQIESSLADPLNLPRWVGTLMVILLSAGFPLTAVLAWIFDLTPQGIKKTESFEESEGKEIIPAPSRRRLKASDAIIVVLAIVVVILAWPKIFRKDAVERLADSGKKLSVAVMPFKNMSNDTSLNVWQDGIQQRFISSFSNSEELQVRRKESIQTLLSGQGVTGLASLSPVVAGTVSEKLEADIFIYGSIQKSGSEIGIDAQLIDTRTKEIIKSFEVSGPSGDNMIFPLADSLRNKVKDFLLIKKLIKENPLFGRYPVLTDSPEAFRCYIIGGKAREKGDCASGVTWGLKALAADSTFADAAFMVENSYACNDQPDLSKQWLIRNYEKRNQMPYDLQIYASWAYAFSFESYEEQVKYLKQLLEIDNNEPGWHYLLGLTYRLMKEYDKAIPEYERSMEICKKWGKEYIEGSNHIQLGWCLHKTGQYKKEKKVYKEFEHYLPNNPWLFYNRAILSLAEKDTLEANKQINKLSSAWKEAFSASDGIVSRRLGLLYSEAGMPDRAENYFRKALSMEPESISIINDFASFFIENNRKLEEVPALMDKAMALAKDKMTYYECLNTKGWSMFKQGKNKEALEIIQKAWDEAPYKVYSIRSHLEEVKKAVEGKK
jgi:Tfp pilus assembly protein PilF/TolB-like protein